MEQNETIYLFTMFIFVGHFSTGSIYNIDNFFHTINVAKLHFLFDDCRCNESTQL